MHWRKRRYARLNDMRPEKLNSLKQPNSRCSTASRACTMGATSLATSGPLARRAILGPHSAPRGPFLAARNTCRSPPPGTKLQPPRSPQGCRRLDAPHPFIEKPNTRPPVRITGAFCTQGQRDRTKMQSPRRGSLQAGALRLGSVRGGRVITSSEPYTTTLLPAQKFAVSPPPDSATIKFRPCKPTDDQPLCGRSDTTSVGVARRLAAGLRSRRFLFSTRAGACRRS
jgi:hypothetical protein